MTRHLASIALAALLLLSTRTSGRADSEGPPAKKDRALVLGGGGPICESWESGLIAGMAENGIDLSQADLIIGTSAGSIVGAQFSINRAPSSMHAFELTLEAIKFAPPPSNAKSPPPAFDAAMFTKKIGELAAGNRPPEQVRTEIGAWALSTHPMMPEDEFVAIFAHLFHDQAWPQAPFQCVAVDADNGSVKILSKDSGVALGRAVAASCAVPGLFPPVIIEGHRYIDGGMRSLTNADVAKDYKVVLVFNFIPNPRTTDIAKSFGTLSDHELKILRDTGSTAQTITPSPASLAAFGPNLQDSSRRAAAFAAGIAQGRIEAQRLKPAW
jgi:NTE family protein